VHDLGIVHRDVKPSNVLLAPPLRSGGAWTAKLTDFGIAHGVDDPRRTSPGIAVGTAAYMAPEQVRSAELTPAVDVYSLGLVLLESLTGEPAYPVSGDVQTALRRLAAPPVIPDSLGSGWVSLLTWMTRTEPEARPAARDVALAAAMLGDDPAPDPDTRGSSPGTAALPGTAGLPGEPETDGVGSTKEYPATGFADAAGSPRRRGRRLRIGALGALAALGVAAIAFAGFWTSENSTGSPSRAGTSSSETAEPPTPSPTSASLPPGNPEMPVVTDGPVAEKTAHGKGNPDSGPKPKHDGPQKSSGGAGNGKG